jgi:hypothetical protein
MSELEAKIMLIHYSDIKGIIYYESIPLKQLTMYSGTFMMVNLLESTKYLLMNGILLHDNETTYAEL